MYLNEILDPGLIHPADSTILSDAHSVSAANIQSNAILSVIKGGLEKLPAITADPAEASLQKRNTEFKDLYIKYLNNSHG